MNQKEIVDEYFNDNMAEIEDVSNRLVRYYLKSKNPEEHASSLITNTYMYVLNVKSVTKNNISNIVMNYMTKQCQWKGTDFKKTFIDNKNVELIENLHSIDNQEDYEDSLEKEFEHQNKMAHLQYKMLNLTTDEKNLYRRVFIEGYNTSGKLSRLLGINRTYCWYQIKELKKKLNQGENDNDNI